MTRTASSPKTRREELLARCQQERNELIATTAVAIAAVPRARDMARTFRGVLRLLRVIARGIQP
ncbi:MAG: hypothetical protein ABI769_13595 [Pseudomonadota bacterium]